MKRIVLTGATGFVGANLARRLLYEGHEVHLLVRPGYSTWRIESIRSHVYLHEVEMSDLEGLLSAIASMQPDWVFHLAAHGAYSSQTNLHQMIQTNIIGTANLIEACLRVGFEAFVNTGTSSEYGFKDHAPSETEWLEPNSHYAVTKASATMLCRHTALSRNVHIPTLRLYSVYGSYEEPTRLIPTLIVRGLHGKLPPLVNPDVARDYVYVDDVNDAYLRAAAQPNQELGAVYNVGTGIQISLREVIDVARQAIDIRIKPQWGTMPNRAWDSCIWVSDTRTVHNRLGWQPHYSFKQGFRAMVDWFREHPALLQFYHERLQEP